MTTNFLCPQHTTFRHSIEQFLYTGMFSRFFMGSATPDTLDSLIPLLQEGSVNQGLKITQGSFSYAQHTLNLSGETSLWQSAQGILSSFSHSLHSFEWLPHLIKLYHDNEDSHQAVLTTIKTHLTSWLKDFSTYDPIFWSFDILSSRIVHWIRVYPLIRSHLSGLEEQRFLRVLNKQAVFLRTKSKTSPFKGHLALYQIRTCLASLCLPYEMAFFAPSLKTLCTTLSSHFLEGGEHISRNSSLQLQMTYEIQLLIKGIEASGITPPPVLQETIDTSTEFLRMLCHDDGGFAIFHGSLEEKTSPIFQMVLGDHLRTSQEEVVKQSKLGYVRIHSKKTTLIADFGKGQGSSDFTHEQHAGLFSFEFSDTGQRVIVNCGVGFTLGDAYEQGFRETSAHSTLSVDSQSIGTLSPSQKGGSYSPPQQVNYTVVKSGSGILLEGSHNAYLKKFGLIHRRRILLQNSSHILQGEDWLTRVVTPENKRGKAPAPETVNHPFTLRFHLHPDVEASVVKGSVLITLPSGQQWVLTPSTARIVLEPSIYTGQEGKPRSCLQIVLTDVAQRQETKIRWALQSLQNTAKEKQEPSVEVSSSYSQTPTDAVQMPVSEPAQSDDNQGLSYELHDQRTLELTPP
jgi:uncharacterized heparinase superfamily protein